MREYDRVAACGAGCADRQAGAFYTVTDRELRRGHVAHNL
ncbi:hypothetical protein SDC9_189485 [bioreactor metagenome]|uniref:Uncharacterized protein n=1 Tax=bioreactor metagenome TaxID=1076179 RepID=A0A645HSV3_9ZZZZ